MFCSTCGTVIPDGQTICPGCGKDMAVNSENQQNNNAAPNGAYNQGENFNQNNGYNPNGNFNQNNGYNPNGNFNQNNGYNPNGNFNQNNGYNPNGNFNQNNGYNPNGNFNQNNGYNPNGNFNQNNGYNPNGNFNQNNGYNQGGAYGIPFQRTVTPELKKQMFKQLSDKENLSFILTLILGIIQCLSFAGIIAGVWNIIVAVQRQKLSKNILNMPSGLAKVYENNMTNIIISGVINLLFGGFIGVALAIYDYFTRDFVLKNGDVFQ